jgi:peroxidase
MALPSAGKALPLVVVLAVAVVASLAQPGAADLRPNYYASSCPNVEAIVRGVVQQRLQATIRTVGSTVRLFFHDCFVEVRSGQLHSARPGRLISHSV